MIVSRHFHDLQLQLRVIYFYLKVPGYFLFKLKRTCLPEVLKLPHAAIAGLEGSAYPATESQRSRARNTLYLPYFSRTNSKLRRLHYELCCYPTSSYIITVSTFIFMIRRRGVRNLPFLFRATEHVG